MSNPIVFLCGSRDFHAMDWYKSAKELLPEKDIFILTDLIAGEGYKKLIDKTDKVFKLVIIDNILLKNQSKIGNIWRNLIKFIVAPVQVMLIKRFSKQFPDAIYHAHSMYYLFLAWAAGIPYIGTPQGSDILIKPDKSRVYKYFTLRVLKSAKYITVDSTIMKGKIFDLTGINALIIQNGIEIDAIRQYLDSVQNNETNRNLILSLRGFTPLYRIREIVDARNCSRIQSNYPITFIYPFKETGYFEEVHSLIKPIDIDLGRIDRNKMYELLVSTKLVISIPLSDSSPRSVYEAIFCGCAVAITYHSYYELLPSCMKSRIILVDIGNIDWFEKSVQMSDLIIQNPYVPSEEALELYDQKRSFTKLTKILLS